MRPGHKQHTWLIERHPDRPNLHLRVVPKIARDRQLLLELITEEIAIAIGDGSEGAQGIVFCQTRRQVETMADGL